MLHQLTQGWLSNTRHFLPRLEQTQTLQPSLPFPASLAQKASALKPTSSSIMQMNSNLCLVIKKKINKLIKKNKKGTRSHSFSALCFISGQQLWQLLCFPPTCSLDGWYPSRSGQRSYRGDCSLPSTHVWVMNQKGLHSLWVQSEEDWLQERKKSKRPSAFNTRNESAGNYKFPSF